MMRYLVVLIVSAAFAVCSHAQVVEINPSVQWTYVRSQKLYLQSDNVYQYEFPAERGHDYIFSLLTENAGLSTWVKIYDIQMKPIAKIEKTNAPQSTALEFNVPATGTYIVALGYANNTNSADKNNVNFDFTLIKRPKVAK